jgi:small subunit ribosomal protein S18
MSKRDSIKIENLPSRTSFRRRRKVCPFSGENGLKIDYKDPKMLLRYMSEKGKIAPSRITAVTHTWAFCLMKLSRSA